MSVNLLQRARNFAADLGMLYLLPAGVALLPWTLGFRLLQRLARSERLFRLAVDPAWAAARRYFPDSDEREWKRRFRLLRLVDHCDTYLTLWRSAAWWQAHIDERGDWPQANGAHVFLTFHWGAGQWIWQRLRTHGFHAYFLARRAQGRALGITRLSHWYGALRAWAIRRIGSRGPWFVGDSRERLREALRHEASVVGMLDLPPRGDQQTLATSLLDRSLRLPSGLVALALESGAAITLFSAGLDLTTGRRNLWIENLPAGTAASEIMRRYAAHLDVRLRECPEFWQIWREAPAMFGASAGADQAL